MRTSRSLNTPLGKLLNHLSMQQNALGMQNMHTQLTGPGRGMITRKSVVSEKDANGRYGFRVGRSKIGGNDIVK